jgi:hypothetical protein
VHAAVHTFFGQMRVVMLLWLAVVALAFGAFIYISVRRQRRLRRPQGPAPALLSALTGAGDTVVIDPGMTQIIGTHQAQAEEPTVVVDTIGSEGRELDRFADELAVAAKRASVMADRRHEQWQAAQRTREAAWDAYNRADAEVQRLERAAVFPTTVPDDEAESTQDDAADRERYLKRFVTAAYERGELSSAEFRAALAHRDGWEPTLHPFALQRKLRRLVRDRRLRAYQEAAAVEQAAWHAADLAAAARSSLHAEALAAEHRNTAQRMSAQVEQRVNRAKTKSTNRNTWSRSRAGDLAVR